MAGKMVPYKLIVLGDGGVGKTALTIQLCLNHFVETYDPTIEDLYVKQISVDNQACMLEILDTAGQEEYTALRDQWIRDGEAFILVYSISSRSSFVRVKRFHHQIQRVKESSAMYQGYSLSTTPQPLQPAPIMLVGNKSDRVTEREVSTQEGHALARELGCEFVEASAKNCYNVQKSAYDLIRILRRQRMALANPNTNRGASSEAGKYKDRRTSSDAYRMTRTFWGKRRISIPADEAKTEAGRARLLSRVVQSAKTNDETMVLAYIAAGADVSGHVGAEGSPLHAAAAAGHANIVNILIKSGAGINALGPTGVPPLQLAAAQGHLAVVRLLVHKGAAMDQVSTLHGTALSAAASRGRVDVVRFLLKKGASVSIPGGPYGTPLLAAAWNGNADVIKYLIESGADIKARGGGECTALQMAAFVGKAGAVRALLDRGAKLDIDAPGGKYGSALKAANDGGHYEAVTLLLEAGATPLDLDIPPEDVESDENAEDDFTAGNDSQDTNNTLEQLLQSAAPAEESPALEPPSSDCGSLQTVASPMSPISAISTTQNPSIPSNLITSGQTDADLSKLSLSSGTRRLVHSLGFTTIHDADNAVVDIVFVHGLQGHPERTWTYQGPNPKSGSSLRQKLFGSPFSSAHPEPIPVYWPYDLLAQSEDFANTRIMTWGYDTKVVKDFFGTSDRQNISQHGNNLLVSLQQERKSNPDRPVIFVCHSLGGIVVKVALDNSRKSTHQPQYLSVYKATRGILFLGTPHSGSSMADWGVIASNITKCVLQSPSQQVLRTLTPNNELLEYLKKAFLQMLEDNHFSIHSFYETTEMKGFYGPKTMVVPFDSALIGHARKEISLGLPGNHSEICKFPNADHPGYRAVFGALQDYVREAKKVDAIKPAPVSSLPPALGLPQFSFENLSSSIKPIKSDTFMGPLGNERRDIGLAM